MSKLDWDKFYASIREVYWESLPPDLQISARPDPPADEPAVPDDVWQAILLVFPSPEAWLHNPVPQFAGRTPIDAIAAGELDEVKGLIEGVAGFFLPDPSEIVPYRPEDAAG